MNIRASPAHRPPEPGPVVWHEKVTEEVTDLRFGVDFDTRTAYLLRDRMQASADARLITVAMFKEGKWFTLYEEELSEDAGDGWPTPAMLAITQILSDVRAFLLESIL